MIKQENLYKVKLVSKRKKIALLCSVIACVLFFVSYLMTFPVQMADCQTVITSFEYCKMVRGKYLSDRGLHIFCSNSEVYYIDDAYIGYGLKEEIEELNEGSKLTLVVSDDAEIVELSADDNILFLYTDYVQLVEKEKREMLWLFLFVLIIPIINIIEIHKEKNRFNGN